MCAAMFAYDAVLLFNECEVLFLVMYFRNVFTLKLSGFAV